MPRLVKDGTPPSLWKRVRSTRGRMGSFLPARTLVEEAPTPPEHQPGAWPWRNAQASH